ncbi:RNA polymerase sigma factor [Anaerobranca californiensis DSM 14826]|jgi:RNA polymerase sigma factor|uniref:RNA polymerase sigma factor SigI n=1 Tax=Anaerobranca californiensis DSM 14826 TaxID=1120989 RepID=A0A1M6QIS6_9FIRM|nr:sigma factor [Anaerobranca californiensis]SHK19963.1 RNA polymerase sigma factor [Anaerobranca californiensis DSM 14826]
MDEINYKVMEIANCPTKLEKFILDYENFILKCAYKVTKKYITKNDDEWSIALNAFYEAIKKYNVDKGNFFNFAQIVIQRKLIDYYRIEVKNNHEVTVDDTDAYLYSLKGKEVFDKDIRWEIEAISDVLKGYGFSFTDLVKSSPKTKKTKRYCEEIIIYLLLNQNLIEDMEKSKQLPIKKIEKNTKIPQKIIERHRRYIIAVVEIFKGDYIYLSEYFPDIKKGLNGGE